MLKQSAKLPSSLRLCAGALLGVLMVAPASAWEPSKPVEIVVAAGAGGASDQMARMLQAAVQKNNLMKQPLIVSLKGGASGAEGLMYMKQGEGDAHNLAAPAGELQRVRAPAAVRADRRHLAVVLAHSPASGMAFEQEAVLLHQPIDALGVDRGQTVGSPLAL